MSETILGCPHCEHGRTFDLTVSGVQEKATFSTADGEPYVRQAGTVSVHDHDENELRCRTCGEITSEDKLVPVDQEGV
jgi:hypothetical protein